MQDRIGKVAKNNLILLFIFISYYLLNTYYGFHIDCLFNKVTGYDCPGCGITRCLFSLVKLDFKSAFRFNPLVVILLPWSIIYYMYVTYIYIWGKKNTIESKKWFKFLEIVLIIVTIVFGIARNF